MEKARRKRIRSLISTLNKIRRRQSKKIDILCNDIIDSQKNFVSQLQSFNFSLEFYEAVVGQTSLDKLVLSGGRKIIENISGCSAGIFLLEPQSFKFHLTDDTNAIDIDTQKIKDCFNDELISNICRSNAVCSVDDMFGMGLQGSLSMLGQVSIYAIPLGGFGPAVGFILIWRKAANPIKQSELDRVKSIAVPFARSIRACQSFAHTVKTV